MTAVAIDPDLSWIQTARAMEIEAIDGGRGSNEFTLAPTDGYGNPEEEPVNTKPVDDADETEERVRILTQYISYVQAAFTERGLTYPFRVSQAGDSLTVLPGPEMRALGVKVAQLSRIISITGRPAKEFERRGFQALHKYMGGIGTCVGASREGAGLGTARAVEVFRTTLLNHEKGGYSEEYPPNADLGADGFIIMGRPWHGPIVFYQSKNTPFSLRDFPAEFARVPAIVQSWFGRALCAVRPVLPVYATNTILTMTAREEIYRMQGAAAVTIIDAADILLAELGGGVPAPLCTIL